MARNSTLTGSSKADQIRQAARLLPAPVRPRDVIAALAEQGVDVSRGQVSQVLLSIGMRRGGRRRKKIAAGGSVKAESPLLDLQALIAAKKLADQLGGINAAKQAVDALAKLS